ncbi:hypothetical protein [Microbacterium sp.]|uniref:hypothetical protein n=1 Tax=Microbacterium sp. TaxID=51671 RepID=UPI0025E8F7EB|nr:hypothetical protein [Microbacterium sp.]
MKASTATAAPPIAATIPTDHGPVIDSVRCQKITKATRKPRTSATAPVSRASVSRI